MDKNFRKTFDRLQGLLHADGQQDNCPSYAVMKPLQRNGFVVWRGYVHGKHAPGDKIITDDRRGWYITDKGRELLRHWAT